jgi:hypothetical protein
MPTQIPKSIAEGFGFYIIVVVLAAIAWLSQDDMTARTQRFLKANAQAQGGVVGQAVVLDDTKQRQLDAYLEMNRLLTTLGTTLLGGLGFLLFGREKGAPMTRHRWAAFVSVFCVAISIFFGYVAYLFILSMLGNGLFDLTTLSVHWAQQAHFYTFLAGVVFFADFAFCNLTKEGSRENLQTSIGP